MSLYIKMFNVMNESEAIEKNMEVGTGKNSYKAVSEATILNMIKPLFKKYELIIFPIGGDIKDHCMTWDKTDYDGKTSQTLRAITELKVTYRILDVESGEFQDVVGFGNGADSQDKGAGKAFTYSLKNALSKTFMLFSGEDTDNEHSDDIGRSQKPLQQTKSVQITNNPPVQQTSAQSADKPSGDVISEAQAKRLFAIAKGDIPFITKVLARHNYAKSKDVLRTDYDAICKEIEHPLNESKIDLCPKCGREITVCECGLPF